MASNIASSPIIFCKLSFCFKIIIANKKGGSIANFAAILIIEGVK